MTGIKVVAAVLDGERLTLYKEDGQTVILTQGDVRIRSILNSIVPILNAGGVATVDLNADSHYTQFEKKTNGLVRLFRVAKSSVTKLLGLQESLVQTQKFGQVPGMSEAAMKQVAAIEEILDQAATSNTVAIEGEELLPSETMVAVVGSGNDTRVVPGVEALKDQIAHANNLNNPQGVKNLIKRLAAIGSQRDHSVDDVLRFLDRADLPVADDGSIIAYKVLNYSRNSQEVFVDCHTGKVEQRVGSFVCMDEKLVDRNRRQQCSVGLHIARRGYLKSFGGNICTLVKLAPEDVITVPTNEPDKVRARGYLILGILPSEDWVQLTAGKPIMSVAGKKLLTDAISGKHVKCLEVVTISGENGTDVSVVTGDLEKALPKAAPKTVPSTTKAMALDDPEVAKKTDTLISPTEVSKQVLATKSGSANTRQQLAQELMRRVENLDLKPALRLEAANALAGVKKKSKVSYSVLGISDQQVETLLKAVKGELTMKPVEKKDPAPKPKKPAPKKAPAKAKAPPPLPATATLPKNMSSTVKARYLFNEFNDTNASINSRYRSARDLELHKRASKKSWTALGLPADTPTVIAKFFLDNK